MKLSKLKRIHVIIIGSVVCILIGVGTFFLLIKPQMEALKALQGRYDAAHQVAVQEPFARQDLAKAKLEVAMTQKTMDNYMAAKMPVVDLSTRTAGMLQLWQEQCETLGPLLERYINRSGVRLMDESIPVAAPPVNPNDPTYSGTPIVLSLGPIHVQGNFTQILSSIRKWNNCNRLVMVDAPTLSGQSPALQAEYKITVVIFPKGTAGPAIDMAGTPGAAGTTGAPTPGAPAPMAAPATGAAPAEGAAPAAGGAPSDINPATGLPNSVQM